MNVFETLGLFWIIFSVIITHAAVIYFAYLGIKYKLKYGNEELIPISQVIRLDKEVTYHGKG